MVTYVTNADTLEISVVEAVKDSINIVMEKNMSKIIWENRWNFYDPTIDDQHKKLIKLLNQIRCDEIKTGELMAEFVDYSAKHFADEEKLMSDVNYPEYHFNLHKQEHRNFTNALMDVSFKILEVQGCLGEAKVIINRFKRFCFIWFENHFLGTDRSLSKFLQDKETHLIG